MLVFDNVAFGYGRNSALFNGLSLELKPGSIHGLLGLNGAGKTSLLKLAAGALRPASGGIAVFGRSPGKREAAALADIAFVPEDPWVPALKPAGWISRHAVFRPAFNVELFTRLLEEFELDRDKLISKYSYGQRKKFSIAAALASGARVLLFDEPTNGLDIPSKSQFRRALTSALSPDTIIVVSTHQVRDLESIIDPLIVVHRGKVVLTVDSARINEKLCSARLASFDGDAVYAERDAVGWLSLVARGAETDTESPPDIELFFNAAIAAPERLRLALSGEALFSDEAAELRTRKDAQ